MFTSYLFVIGQFVLKVISYWLTANNRKLINFLSTQFFNLRKCIESIFEEHFNWNDSNMTTVRNNLVCVVSRNVALNNNQSQTFHKTQTFRIFKIYNYAFKL